MDSYVTLDDIYKTLEELEPKTVYMNQKTYSKLLEMIDFKPTNVVVVNNFLENNQALVLTETQKENMNKMFFRPKVPGSQFEETE